MKKLFPKWLVVFLVVTITGIIFITIYYSTSSPRSIFIEILGTLGKTIFGSGIFLVLLKSIQFLGIFQDELRKVVFSEELLNKRNDLHEIWKKVTRAFYQSAFPEISLKIETLIQNKILPQKLNYYHQNVVVIYEINKFDDDHFELIEYQSFDIKSNGDTFNFIAANHLIKTKESTDYSDLEIIELLINDISHSDKIEKKDAESIDELQLILKCGCSFHLNGSREYCVKKTTKSIHTNKMNGYWKFSIGRITDSFTIDIRNNGDYEIDLVPFGGNANFQSIFISSTLNISKHYDIMMPGDGFVLLVKQKFTNH